MYCWCCTANVSKESSDETIKWFQEKGMEIIRRGYEIQGKWERGSAEKFPLFVTKERRGSDDGTGHNRTKQEKEKDADKKKKERKREVCSGFFLADELAHFLVFCIACIRVGIVVTTYYQELRLLVRLARFFLGFRSSWFLGQERRRHRSPLFVFFVIFSLGSISSVEYREDFILIEF